MTPTVTVVDHAQSYSVKVTHPCAHVYTSASRWNSEAAAKRHGRALLKCVCSVCRNR